MTALKSLIFNACFAGVSTVFSLAMLFVLPLSRGPVQTMLWLWARTVYRLAKLVVGLDCEVRGLEHVPDGAVVFASKHQSAWDVGIFYALTRDPAYVIKRELLVVPFFGWFMARADMIGVDRAGGPTALKKMVRDVEAALDEGRGVVIFPEGTRTPPGERRPYHPGVAAVYARDAAPLVPVAVNSGYFWGRRSYLKHPGVVVIEALPAVPPGLDRRAFMTELENRIEAATERLHAEAAAKYPR